MYAQSRQSFAIPFTLFNFKGTERISNSNSSEICFNLLIFESPLERNWGFGTIFLMGCQWNLRHRGTKNQTLCAQDSQIDLPDAVSLRKFHCLGTAPNEMTPFQVCCNWEIFRLQSFSFFAGQILQTNWFARNYSCIIISLISISKIEGLSNMHMMHSPQLLHFYKTLQVQILRKQYASSTASAWVASPLTNKKSANSGLSVVDHY